MGGAAGLGRLLAFSVVAIACFAAPAASDTRKSGYAIGSVDDAKDRPYAGGTLAVAFNLGVGWRNAAAAQRALDNSAREIETSIRPRYEHHRSILTSNPSRSLRSRAERCMVRSYGATENHPHH